MSSLVGQCVDCSDATAYDAFVPGAVLSLDRNSRGFLCGHSVTFEVTALRCARIERLDRIAPVVMRHPCEEDGCVDALPVQDDAPVARPKPQRGDAVLPSASLELRGEGRSELPNVES